MTDKITWTPIVENGTTYYECRLELAGHMVAERSRKKPDALAHALEAMAKLVRVTGTPDP